MTPEEQAKFLEKFIEDNRPRMKPEHVQNFQLVAATLRLLSKKQETVSNG